MICAVIVSVVFTFDKYQLNSKSILSINHTQAQDDTGARNDTDARNNTDARNDTEAQNYTEVQNGTQNICLSWTTFVDSKWAGTLQRITDQAKTFGIFDELFPYDETRLGGIKYPYGDPIVRVPYSYRVPYSKWFWPDQQLGLHRSDSD